MAFGMCIVKKSIYLPKAKLVEVYRKNSKNQKMSFDDYCTALLRIAKESHLQDLEECSLGLWEITQHLRNDRNSTNSEVGDRGSRMSALHAEPPLLENQDSKRMSQAAKYQGENAGRGSSRDYELQKRANNEMSG